MKKILQLAAVLLLLSTLNFHLSTAHAQGTAFTYQGRLNSGGASANGSYDVVFTLYATNVTGTAVAGPVTNAAVGVTNGLFTTTVDFGSVFTGASRWLELAVRTNGGVNFTTLAPRQPLTPVPYAIFANTASNVSGSVPAASLSGTISLAQLPATLVTNGASGVNFSGTFSGNGAGVTNVNLPANSSGAVTPNSSLFSLDSLPAVDFPGKLVAADLNGDGRPDLITPTTVSTYIQVLTNNGRGRFPSFYALNAYGHPVTVTAADVNGDGRMDLISGDYGNNFLTISTNNGSGGFVGSGFPLSDSPQDVVAADVNGDGRMDLITANYGNTLSVITNNGSGGFIVAATLPVGAVPASVATGDVNGDGKVDLICANSGTNTLSVLTNNGFGFFTLATNVVAGPYPALVVAVDVNGDGKLDLICANSGTNTLSVLTNNGSGKFTLSTSPTVGGGPVSVAAGDVNGDGWVDLISADNGGYTTGHTLTVLTNNRSGGFALATVLDVGVENIPVSVTTADVNGDGRLDIISANYGTYAGKKLAVFLNTPYSFVGNFSGTFTSPIDAANLLLGTLPDARLSDNVAFLNKNQTFIYAHSFMEDMGIGTATPATRLDVRSDSSASQAQVLAANNNADTWVQLWSGYNNGANPPAIIWPIGKMLRFISSTVGGSGGAEFMRIDSAGNVGIGRAPTANKLEVEGNASKTTAGSWLANSDARIKTDVHPVSGALDKLAQVRLVQFHYTDDYRVQHPSIDNRSYLNVIAQEFQQVFPEAVQSGGDRLTNGEAILQVDTYPLTIYSAAAIQELNRKFKDELKRRDDENAALKMRLEKLEQLMNNKTAEPK